MPPIVNLPNGPFASGASLVYTSQIVDGSGEAIPLGELVTVRLTIVDTLTGQVINECDRADVLNAGRGTVDAVGNLTIILDPEDTSMSEVPGERQIERSLVLDFSVGDILYADDGVTPLYADDGVTPLTAGPAIQGRHQANFILLRLAAGS